MVEEIFDCCTYVNILAVKLSFFLRFSNYNTTTNIRMQLEKVFQQSKQLDRRASELEQLISVGESRGIHWNPLCAMR